MIKTSSQLFNLLVLSALVSLPAAGETSPAGARPTTESLTLESALRTALTHDPEIEIAASGVRSAEGVLLSASSEFDNTLTATFDGSDVRTPVNEIESTSAQNFKQTAGWSRKMRSGRTYSSSVELNQPEIDPSASTATVSFSLTQPLWQGRSREVTQSEETAARLEAEAAAYDALHRARERLSAVADRYWIARAAQLDLDILRDTEQRSRELLETTRRLVAADVTPAADLIQLEADLTFRETNRLDGERVLYEALHSLAGAMGLAAEETATLGLPSDEFPKLEVADIPESDRFLLAEAWARRADLQGTEKRLQAAQARLDAAEDALKPTLDLLVTPSYTGWTEGRGLDSAQALVDNVPGLSAALTLSYSRPLENRAAEGALIVDQERTRQLELSLESQRIDIGASVRATLSSVRIQAERLAALERAVSLFAKASENEEKKLRAGSSTLIDVLNQRDRLTTAQQRWVAAEAALARALVQLRFDVGWIAERQADGGLSFDVSELTSLP